MNPQINIGTRSSRLALIQAEEARAVLAGKTRGLKWEIVPFSSPGDRDRLADLTTAPPDFFTRDLDEALLAGKIDCAVHSAKDLPDPLPSGIDFFRLPNPADPRDVLVCRRELVGQASCIQEPVLVRAEDTRSRIREARPTTLSVEPKVIGVSSVRRSEYAKKRFPAATQSPLRGTIEERLAQLDAGKFDTLIMAAAALQRLGLEERIAEWISPDELPAPDGQGALALTFRADDERFLRLRTLFVKSVVFVSAGTGKGYCTQAGAAALRRADVCLYDALLDDALLDELPEDARKIFVGKRSGKHSRSQEEICGMLTNFARQGRRVVRLKGGDAGLYGRLAEEIEALDALQLPYRVIPGVSSLSAATTGTGLLLTRRGVADCAKIISGHPGSVPGETLAVFMGIQSLKETVERLLGEGKSPALPVSVVLDAGGPDQQIISAPLSEITSKVEPSDLPGLVLIGETADPEFIYRSHGALRGKRIWLTCSDEVQTRAAQAVLDFGGIPVQQPLIELIPKNFPDLGKYGWIVLTSPSTVRCLIPQIGDLRRLPKLLCCGQGTANSLKQFQLMPDAMPQGEFNTEGLLETARQVIPRDARILRLRSDLAGPALAEKLRRDFKHVDDFVLCENRTVECEPPDCDAVFFASVSAINSYVKQFGVSSLNRKIVVTIGPKDTEAILKAGWQGTPVAPLRATVEEAVEALAAHLVRQGFLK